MIPFVCIGYANVQLPAFSQKSISFGKVFCFPFINQIFMLKTNIASCAISGNPVCNHLIFVKKVKRAGRITKAEKAIRKYKNVFCYISRRLVKMVAVALLVILIRSKANAQCNVFENADAANPLLSVIPAGKTIQGLDFPDINGDGRLDCYAYFDQNPAPVLFRNTGTNEHPLFTQSSTSGFENTTLPGATRYQQFIDIDGDGDFDFFISDYTSVSDSDAHIHFYENKGTLTSPHFIENPEANPVAFAHAFLSVSFQFADMDGDGDEDFFYYQSCQGDCYGPNVTYLNTGTKFHPAYTLYFTTYGGTEYDRTYYDWNGDELLDYFDYNYYKDIYLVRNIGPKEAPEYLQDRAGTPQFKNGVPYRMIDLNGDGAPEAFDMVGHYSTLAPIAVIKKGKVINGSKTLTVLSSVNRSSAYQYKWEYNNRLIPGATRPSVYALRNGSYTLFITDSCGTGVSLPYIVKTQNVPVSTDKEDAIRITSDKTSEISIKAYPNPFTSGITVQLGSATLSTLKVIDVSGKIRHMQTTAANSVTIGGTLPAGVYVLQVYQGNVLMYHATVVKQ